MRIVFTAVEQQPISPANNDPVRETVLLLYDAGIH